ncbi:hypothetical protein FLP41_15930 [Paracoccus marcusii]|uniref:hypothetical protein n=1 Tax=Paracoccus marcusii TaxID=59779 RepID=UPI002ED4D17B|nr:hypothetical protein FLP41_15930 [Paracoccus marcusii]
MRKAEQAAMKVMDEIDPELDAAFAPVYAGIPRYMDFHYSLKGEWLELSASVLGQMESQLDEHLFTGLEDRIANISQGLQTDFDRLWLASVEASVAESLAAEGPFVEIARRSVGMPRNGSGRRLSYLEASGWGYCTRGRAARGCKQARPEDCRQGRRQDGRAVGDGGEWCRERSVAMQLGRSGSSSLRCGGHRRYMGRRGLRHDQAR